MSDPSPMPPIPTPSGFVERCRDHARATPARIAVATADLEMSYAALLGAVEDGMAFLAAGGIGAGAVVGLTIRDEIDHLIASLSLLGVGARQITLASHDHVRMREELAGRVAVSHMLVDDAAGALGREPLTWAPDRDAGAASLAPGPSGGGTIFLNTSGTTGRTNIIEFTEAQIALQAERNPEYAGERLLRPASIEHNNAKRHRLYALWNGGTNIFLDSDRPDLATYVRDSRTTCLDLSRMHLEGLPRIADPAALSGVKLRADGSLIPWRIRREIERSVTPGLYVRYGSTETGTIAIAGPGEHDADESVGRPVPGVDVRIVGPSGEDMPAGETGAIAIRAPGMAEGYADNDAQTAARFRDGWFHPGDLGYRRADGRIVVQGRADEMIIMAGLNIFPREIEAVLESHPDVAGAAALALESRIHGQIPVAAVELAAGAALSGVELARWAQPLLGLRAPKRVIVVPALPRNAQGKVIKAELAALFAARPVV